MYLSYRLQKGTQRILSHPYQEVVHATRLCQPTGCCRAPQLLILLDNVADEALAARPADVCIFYRRFRGGFLLCALEKSLAGLQQVDHCERIDCAEGLDMSCLML